MSTNAVHALGALLFEMEVIRGYLEPHELPYFDATLAPAQNSSIKALNRLQGKISPLIIHSIFSNCIKTYCCMILTIKLIYY